MTSSPWLCLALGLFAHAAAAQTTHDLGLLLGGLRGPSRALAGSSASSVTASSGLALQANYAHRLALWKPLAVYAEAHFLANGLREVRASNPAVTRDYATLYVTPGIRLRFAWRSRVSPYTFLGGGYGLYEQSFFQSNGQSNTAPRFTHRGVLTYGAGADVKTFWIASLRGEVRDFYAGLPSYNIPVQRGGQHNLVISGGFSLRWGGHEK